MSIDYVKCKVCGERGFSNIHKCKPRRVRGPHAPDHAAIRRPGATAQIEALERQVAELLARVNAMEIVAPTISVNRLDLVPA
jgi:hypothetical protein